MRVLERIPGNPIGIAYKQVTPYAVALMARHLPPFNRVVGLRDGDERHIASLIEWYRENGVSPRFELSPGDASTSLGRELAECGYFQSDVTASLVADPAVAAAAPRTGVVTERVMSPDVMEEFLNAYVRGWAIPDKFHDGFKANVRPWLDEPDWALYVARVDGQVGAAAVLYVHGKVGYFADGATDPAFRGRGLHTALLARRFADARAAEVDLICGQAAFLSASHRNQERVGLHLLALRAFWTGRN